MISMAAFFRSGCAVVVGLASVVVVATIRAEPVAKEDAKKADQSAQDEAYWQKLFREMAGEYEIVATGKAERKFPLRSAPVFRWNQPVRIADGGSVYVWLDEGRPAVVGTMFAWPDDVGNLHVAHEMHALTLGPMRASYAGKEIWSLEKPALAFRRVPGAALPAPTATQRLAQMRTLGREFTATSIDRKDGEWVLRLLGQPLYRYELKDGREQADGDELLDGAVLSFVQGTDPEILLILEARRDGDGSYWQYALARFSDYRLVVKHKDAEVWRVGGSDQNDNKAYFVRTVDHK
jgi:hypothetical protein